MLRYTLAFALIPAALFAQAATQPAKPAPSTQKPVTTQSKPAAPAAPKPAAPAAATRKPAPTTAKPAPGTAKPAAPASAPMTDDQKTIYALGLLLQRNLGPFDLNAAELDIIKRALNDATAGKPAIDLEEWGPKIDPLARARRERVSVREKAASVGYLAKAATEVGATKSASGLVYRELTAGSGVSPTASDRVRVHYRGTLINGTEFDSSYKRNEPAEFALSGVVPCWTEGVQKMKPGGKARLVCPSDLAYGDNGAPGIPGGAALIFEIELLEVLGR